MHTTFTRLLLAAALLASAQTPTAQGFYDTPVIHTPPVKMTGRGRDSAVRGDPPKALFTPRQGEVTPPTIRTPPLEMVGRR
jgi:hypothetical protein